MGSGVLSLYFYRTVAIHRTSRPVMSQELRSDLLKLQRQLILDQLYCRYIPYSAVCSNERRGSTRTMLVLYTEPCQTASKPWMECNITASRRALCRATQFATYTYLQVTSAQSSTGRLNDYKCGCYSEGPSPTATTYDIKKSY